MPYGFLAFCGTLLPLLVQCGGAPWMPNGGGVLMLYGFAMHLGAKISLFRSFGVVPADRGIRVKGLHAFVRPPMYDGCFLTHAGFLLGSPSLFNLLVYLCCWGVQLSRMFAQERLLSEWAEYRD